MLNFMTRILKPVTLYLVVDGSSVNACEDGSNECETFLANNPTACEEHADFAWHKCRRSCARGGN